MSILITGGAGFIASHIVDALIDLGYEVIIVDNLSTGKINNINKKAKFYEIDIADSKIENVFQENNVEYVFHYAAQASVSVSEKSPIMDAKNNIIGTINLLSLSKQYNVKKIIAASTAAVYGDPLYLPVDENHPSNILSFYALSKYTMENYIKHFGIDYVIFRFSNVYGPRQDANGEAGVISIFIDKFLSKEPVQIHGDGEQIRDFIYVKDVVKANMSILTSDIKNEIINISTSASSTINELYSNLHRFFNADYGINYVSSRSGDIKKSILDNSKAAKCLKWNCEFGLCEGLKYTLESFWEKNT